MLSIGNMLSTRFINRNVTPPDFQLDLMIQREKIEFLVRKRPHVDLFLKKVAKWYDLVVFTASLEMYGSEVCDMLERDSGIKFKAKYYRQHCVQENPQSFTKDLKVSLYETCDQYANNSHHFFTRMNEVHFCTIVFCQQQYLLLKYLLVDLLAIDSYIFWWIQ